MEKKSNSVPVTRTISRSSCGVNREANIANIEERNVEGKIFDKIFDSLAHYRLCMFFFANNDETLFRFAG